MINKLETLDLFTMGMGIFYGVFSLLRESNTSIAILTLLLAISFTVLLLNKYVIKKYTDQKMNDLINKLKTS